MFCGGSRWLISDIEEFVCEFELELSEALRCKKEKFFQKNFDAKKFENQHYGLVLKMVGCSQDDLIYELDDLIWKVQYLLSAI